MLCALYFSLFLNFDITYLLNAFMLFIGKTLNAALFADCTLPLLRLEERTTTTINVIKNKQKKQARMLLSPLECIVVIKVSVTVLCLLNIHQMGYFTLLGLFYT